MTMPAGGNIDIVFHPSHTPSLAAIKEELRNISRNTNINFIESYEIDPASLAIKTDFGEIKVGLREFFTEIAKQLRLPGN
jgi:flagellar biosynthesis/type III secretory pathway protein FliH